MLASHSVQASRPHTDLCFLLGVKGKLANVPAAWWKSLLFLLSLFSLERLELILASECSLCCGIDSQACLLTGVFKDCYRL